MTKSTKISWAGSFDIKFGSDIWKWKYFKWIFLRHMIISRHLFTGFWNRMGIHSFWLASLMYAFSDAFMKNKCQLWCELFAAIMGNLRSTMVYAYMHFDSYWFIYSFFEKQEKNLWCLPVTRGVLHLKLSCIVSDICPALTTHSYL